MNDHTIQTSEPVWQYRELYVDSAGNLRVGTDHVEAITDESINVGPAYACSCGEHFTDEDSALDHLADETDVERGEW